MNSFYADLAQFDSKQSNEIETMVAVQKPEIEIVSKLNNNNDTINNTLEEEKEIVKPKKKKKVILMLLIIV